MPDAHFEIVALLPSRVFAGRYRDRRGRLAALGKGQEAAELPRGHLAVVIPKLRVEDVEDARLSRDQIFEDQRNARAHRDELADPTIDIHVAVADIHPSHGDAFGHAPDGAVA